MKISITTTAECLANIFAERYSLKGDKMLSDLLTEAETPRITLGPMDVEGPVALGSNPITITWETSE